MLGVTEGVGVIYPGEMKARGRPYNSLQVHERKFMGRWGLTSYPRKPLTGPEDMACPY